MRLLHPEATVTMSGPEVIARADAAKVSSILRNVIDNAMRAAGPQGKVHVVVREHDQIAIAEVWDSGPGVPPSERMRIFERLVRLDHGRSDDRAALGSGWRSPAATPGHTVVISLVRIHMALAPCSGSCTPARAAMQRRTPLRI